jgi:hypothetical protein
MPIAPEIEPVALGVAIWRFYDPSVKADLFSTALEASSGTYLFDPIPLAPVAMADLGRMAKVAGIIVTNENHERAAAQFAETFEVPIFLEPTTTTAGRGIAPTSENGFPSELTFVRIEGGPPGEIAIHSGETMIIGDSLINFEPSGFAFLPPKYCTDAKVMQRSLTKLLDYSFKRMFFAHGLPILTGARERLGQLINEHR